MRRGEPRAYQDNGDGTIRDKRAALTWEKLSDDGSIHDKDLTYTWAQAFEKIDELNTDPCFAGFCDWRLPSSFELYTLVNHENVDPAVSAPFDNGCSGNKGCSAAECSCTASAFYWTSTSAAAGPAAAWGVEFSEGYVGAADKTAATLRVRAVRGGS